MILTITLNTSIDKAYRLLGPLAGGTVMRVAACSDSAGGKGLNASRAVAACGEEVCATGFVGGHNGALLCELLAQDGIPERFVRVASETRCCVNVLEPDGRSTEFLEPGRPVTAQELDELLELVDGLAAEADVVTMSGSIPAGLDTDTWRRLAERVGARGVPVVLDTSGDGLLHGIDALPCAIKPNTDEIAQVVGHHIRSTEDVCAAARGLHERGIPNVIVSLGADGAILACDEGTFLGRAPVVKAVNPVGSGDTMVGAFAVAIARGMGAPERLRFAMSRATANCLSPQTGRFDADVADELLAETTIGNMD